MTSESLVETQLLARQFVDGLAPGHSARIVALYGDLGSGKTSFAQGVASCLKVGEQVQSPTYVIEKIYKTKHSAFKKLVHIDAYRLESSKELEKLGWRDLIADPDNLILVEWPERVADLMPDNADIVRFEFVDENARKIDFEYGK
ncbi:MAG TPA: tRNA (adenosine(37)-N6)-threonylcarbamoyltransferase complex ATPase subunit type 1 TsaE [Candidatus Paceibacterota bacterium]|jgi:tRNA threonylcarbamoyladenosine biosynthesis protein TsaE|nr:tRNA (adenosine(37)-N6)-threonylcarbamoyltransferase complex ATPase subunit type 1 TsaE [Candidatus Paceibacterota bacterium]